MRIATWNVNSLKARQDAVERWLERADPDVLLMQETKLPDQDAPTMAFAMAGYDLIHHGEGRWNGVAVAVRHGMSAGGVVTNFGLGGVRDSSAGATTSVSEEDFDPLDEARMMSVTADGVRIVSIYAPNGRVVGSPFFDGKLAWYQRLRQWLHESCDPGEDLVIGGDFNIAPTDLDVWDPSAAHGGTHVSAAERGAFQRLLDWGTIDAYRLQHDDPGRFTWWDYRAGMFHKNFGMRIDHLLVTKSVAARVVDAEIDREARKGPPVPSDHAPLSIDLDSPGKSFDPDWEGALKRIASRSKS